MSVNMYWAPVSDDGDHIEGGTSGFHAILIDEFGDPVIIVRTDESLGFLRGLAVSGWFSQSEKLIHALDRWGKISVWGVY